MKGQLGTSHVATLEAVSLLWDRGERPTIPAVMLLTGLSRGYVHAILARLRAVGLVSWEDGRAATIRPTFEVRPASPHEPLFADTVRGESVPGAVVAARAPASPFSDKEPA